MKNVIDKNKFLILSAILAVIIIQSLFRRVLFNIDNQGLLPTPQETYVSTTSQSSPLVFHLPRDSSSSTYSPMNEIELYRSFPSWSRPDGHSFIAVTNAPHRLHYFNIKISPAQTTGGHEEGISFSYEFPESLAGYEIVTTICKGESPEAKASEGIYLIDDVTGYIVGSPERLSLSTSSSKLTKYDWNLKEIYFGGGFQATYATTSEGTYRIVVILSEPFTRSCRGKAVEGVEGTFTDSYIEDISEQIIGLGYTDPFTLER